MNEPAARASVDVWLAPGSQGFTGADVGRVLGSYPGRTDGTVRLRRDAYGRPEVGGRDDLTVSISHTEEMTLVAVGVGCRVGVDVEIVRDRGLFRLPEQALTRAELQALLRIDPADRLAGFLSYWVRKEALLKAAGLGLAVEPALIELPPQRCGTGASFVPAALGRADQWTVVELELDGYAAAVAVDVPSATIRTDLSCRDSRAGGAEQIVHER